LNTLFKLCFLVLVDGLKPAVAGLPGRGSTTAQNRQRKHFTEGVKELQGLFQAI
jgi:hypothetical protein